MYMIHQIRHLKLPIILELLSDNPGAIHILRLLLEIKRISLKSTLLLLIDLLQNDAEAHAHDNQPVEDDYTEE